MERTDFTVLGHSQIGVSMSTYAHVIPALVRPLNSLTRSSRSARRSLRDVSSGVFSEATRQFPNDVHLLPHPRSRHASRALAQDHRTKESVGEGPRITCPSGLSAGAHVRVRRRLRRPRFRESQRRSSPGQNTFATRIRRRGGPAPYPRAAGRAFGSPTETDGGWRGTRPRPPIAHTA